jgi:hypothetical protein
LCTTAEISSTLIREQFVLKRFLGNEKVHLVFDLFEGEKKKPARENGEEELEVWNKTWPDTAEIHRI